MSEELKQRARQIIQQLAALNESKRLGGGVHGQVIGMEQYVIRSTGNGLECLYEAQYLIDELVDPFDRRIDKVSTETPAQPHSPVPRMGGHGAPDDATGSQP